MYASILTDDVEQPNKDLVRAAQSLIDCSNNRRQEQRRPLTLPCYIVPVDEDDKPRGKTIPAITTDISSGGISLLYTRAMEPQRVLMKISKSPEVSIHLIAEIVRCGEVNGYFKIGAKFIKKVSP